mgnify:CR=1 FL=1|tara:strand:+ start:2978 stop:3796 length:819 start_codon:yes stop_codon:yes gene_type:complete
MMNVNGFLLIKSRLEMGDKETVALPDKSRALIYTHQGLGDQIECIGMIRHMADTFDEVHILSKAQHLDSVKYIYQDNPKINIHCIPLQNSNEYEAEKRWFVANFSSFDGEVFIPGHHNYFSKMGEFNQRQVAAAPAFYEILGIPYSLKFEKFYFQRDHLEESRVYKKLNPNEEKYVFVHDDESRGFCMDLKTDYKIIRNDVSENVFHMTKVLENAEEIHCMSSSMFCLIDCMASSSLFETNLNKKRKLLHWNIRKVFLGKNYMGADNWEVLR